MREALARAYFRTGRFDAAEEEFLATLDIEPVNDYAQFGVGLCRLRAGDRAGARGHLRLATVMRPDNADYRAALEQVADAGRDAGARRRDRRAASRPVVCCDLDGVIWRGDNRSRVRPTASRSCAPPALRVVFLTNNSSGRVSDNVAKLGGDRVSNARPPTW